MFEMNWYTRNETDISKKILILLELNFPPSKIKEWVENSNMSLTLS